MIIVRSAFGQNGQASWGKRQRALQRQQISRRSADGVMTEKSGSPLHSGQFRAIPTREVGSRHDRVGGARQERTHRLQHHRIRARRHPRSTQRSVRLDRFVPVFAMPGSCSESRDNASTDLKSPSSSASCVRIADAVARTRNRRSPQSIGRCSNCRIGPRPSSLVEVRRFELDRGQGHAALHAPLKLEELDLEIDGRAKIRLLRLQLPQLGDLARLGSLGRRRLGLARTGFYQQRGSAGQRQTKRARGSIPGPSSLAPCRRSASDGDGLPGDEVPRLRSGRPRRRGNGADR